MPRACNSSTAALSGMDKSQERRKEKEKGGAQKMVKSGALQAGAIYCILPAEVLVACQQSKLGPSYVFKAKISARKQARQ